jgi:hypothetical protein
MANILLPHRQRTIRRMMGQQTVLCIQDGTDVDYTNLDQCQGLDETVTNQTGAKRRGLHLHSTFCVAPNGLPLGVLKSQSKEDPAAGAERQRPIEEKKTFVWIEHHRDLVETAAAMPQTRLIDICDREADFFELFDEQRQSDRVELLVRAQHDRNLDGNPKKLFAAVREAPVVGQIRVPIQRQSARPKKSKQQASAKRTGRLADLSLRCMSFQLPPRSAGQSPIDLCVVHALESEPPANNAALEWFLLTTLDVQSAADAEQCLRWYCLRWRIEDWHRVLKSGCRIEDLQHETAERLRRAIAINMVIAWRIMLMTLLGRESPDLAAEVLFSDIELRVLRSYAKKKRLPPPEGVGAAVLVIAKLGGYLGRAKDPPPGHQLLWYGYAAFEFMCMAFELLESEQDGPE